MANTSKVLGIDLGTGFSCMAVMEGGQPKVIVNADGARTTPSIVAWTKNGERLVGQAAKRQAITNPKNTVYEIKRFIGRKYDEVIDDIKMVSYDVVKADNGDVRVKIGDKLYSPEEISSFILSKLKTDAEAFLGEKITDAVITVPAYFNNAQRQATRDAGTIAGFNVLRIVNEPTAASLAYGLDKEGKNCVIAVADAGSGTYDVSILDLSDGVFEVKATNGDTRLGGKDYDQAIMNWLADEFKQENGIDLRNDQMALQRLKDESEKAKIALSTTELVEINIPFITADASGPKHLVKSLSRAKFESLVSDINDRLIPPCKNCINDSGSKIDKVILVGGTTRIPSVQQKIKEAFGIEPSKDVNADEAVAEGAAIQGGILRGDVSDVLLLDVTPLTLSICTNGSVATPMISRNTTIPTKKSETFSNAAPMQAQATVAIAQGERPMFADNKLLGQFNVEITPMPSPGMNQIEITYDIDANGILTVSAVDKALNKPANITITSSSGLSKEDIEKAKHEAEVHAEEDKKRLEVVNAKNSAESLCNSLEKSMKEAGDKLSEDEKKPIAEAIAKLREGIKSNDLEKIKNSSESLTKLWEPVVTKLYASASNGNGSPPPPFTAEQMAEMMKNFNASKTSSSSSGDDTKSNDDFVDASFTN